MRNKLGYLGFALILFLSVGLLASPGHNTAYSADGNLDPTFGGDGLVTTSFENTADEGHAAAIQTDGKIVVAGSTVISDGDTDFSVARYNDDGSLDTTFGGGDGLVTTSFLYQGFMDSANAVKVFPSGKITVAGTTCPADYRYCRFAVARYLSDGSLDPNYHGGTLYHDFGYAYSGALGIASDMNGDILIAGYAYDNDHPSDFAVARLTSYGELDTSFNGVGYLRTDFFGGVDEARAIAVQPDGKIVVAGNAQVNGTNYDFALARYLPNGDLDTSFDGDGKVTTDFLGGDDGAYAIALHPDGYIYAAGGFYSASQGYDFGIARYNPDGSLDTNFDQDGVLDLQLAPGTAEETAYSVTVQPGDGKVVVAGYAPAGGVNNFAVVRLLYDGSLDPTFGTGGVVIHGFDGGASIARALALQPNGQIVAAGSTYEGSNHGDDFAVARYKVGDVPPPPPTYHIYLPFVEK